MNLLFENLEKLTDAPNGIEKARELILQLAVQGKIVKQDPNDEPASELLKKIKKKNDFPIPREYSINYLPKGWVIDTIGNLFITASGGTPSRAKPQYWENGTIPWINSGALKDKVISNPSELITDIGLAESSAKLFPIDAVVIALTGATTAKIGLLKIETSTNQSVTGIFPEYQVEPLYLFYYLISIRAYILSKSLGSAQPHINKFIVDSLPIFLPPHNEQKRIVEKVNSLMSLLDEIQEKREHRNQKRIKLNNASIEKLLTSENDKEQKANWKRIEENFSTLYSVPENVEKLKQAILQLAVQGNLVKQDPKDEPATELLKKIKKEKEKLIAEGKTKKQKELPPIKDEEKPFELPKGWEWCYIDSIAEVVRGGSPRPAGDPQFYDGKIPFLKVADLTADDSMYLNSFTYTIKEAGLRKTRFVKANTLMLTNSGATLGIPKICQFDTTFNDGIAAFLNIPDSIYLPYFYFFLSSKSKWFLEFASQGQGQPNLNTDIIKETLFSFPPLNEQKRIVEKVNELINLCNTLEEKLTKKEATSKRLVGAVVNAVANKTNKSKDDEEKVIKDILVNHKKALEKLS